MTILSAGEDAEKLDPSSAAGRNLERHRHSAEHCGNFLQNQAYTYHVIRPWDSRTSSTEKQNIHPFKIIYTRLHSHFVCHSFKLLQMTWAISVPTAYGNGIASVVQRDTAPQ